MAKKVRKGVRILGAFLFILYLLGLIYFLFLSEGYGRAGMGEYNYNIHPFHEILRFIRYRDLLGTRAVVLNLGGNVIGFMPFGALLPLMARSTRRAWRTTLLSFEISALVEVSQLILRVGCFDVDDMILNTLGGFLGYLLYWCASRIFWSIEKKRMQKKQDKGKRANKKKTYR